MTVDVGRVREEARGYVLSVRFDSPDVGQRLARLAKAYIALCDELDRTREQLREADETLSDLLAAMRGEKVDMLWSNASFWFEEIEEILARLSEATP